MLRMEDFYHELHPDELKLAEAGEYNFGLLKQGHLRLYCVTNLAEMCRSPACGRLPPIRTMSTIYIGWPTSRYPAIRFPKPYSVCSLASS